MLGAGGRSGGSVQPRRLYQRDSTWRGHEVEHGLCNRLCSLLHQREPNHEYDSWSNHNEGWYNEIQHSWGECGDQG